MTVAGVVAGVVAGAAAGPGQTSVSLKSTHQALLPTPGPVHCPTSTMPPTTSPCLGPIYASTGLSSKQLLPALKEPRPKSQVTSACGPGGE